MSDGRDRLKALFKSTSNLYLGAHFSIAGGIYKALISAQTYGCTAAQVFTKNATTWKERQLIDTDILLFRQAVRDTRITHVASHTSYLINLATPERKKRVKSKTALTAELIRSDALGIPFVILHPGSHRGSGTEKGVDRIILAINDIFNENQELSPKLLLETTAGQGTGIGHRFEQLADIVARVSAKNRIGVCLDTCHIFAAGYDLRTKEKYEETITHFDGIIGLSNLYFIHLNDSLKGLGARIDRHAHIGQGAIGREGFRLIMKDPRLADIPKVIETPKGSHGEDFDTVNLVRLLKFFSGDKLNCAQEPLKR